jgi:plastocyanin
MQGKSYKSLRRGVEMRIMRIFAFILLSMTLIPAACSSKTLSAEIHIEYIGGGIEGWRPLSVTVSPGGTVTWVNNGLESATHSVINDDGLFNKTLGYGESFSFTFTKAGTYPFHDNPNNESGTVVVK